jgi:seryl-tRNA synthetase
MLDIAYIRDNQELVKNGMSAKGEKDLAAVDELLTADDQWRQVVRELDLLRGESNAAAKQIGMLMGQGKKDEAQEMIGKTADYKERIKALESQEKDVAEKRQELLYRIPNVPHPSVPVGSNEHDNVVHHTWGTPMETEWRRPHWDIVKEKGWIDFERGVKVTGAGFPFYIGPMAR